MKLLQKDYSLTSKSTDMKIRRLRQLLYEMKNDGYDDWTVYFCDQDGDSYTIDYICCDDDNDCCLQSNSNYRGDLTVDEILNELEAYDEEDFVYVEHVDEDDNVYTWLNIDGIWYYCEDNSELTIDMHYDKNYDDDDDYDYDDDDDDGGIENEWYSCECPKCGSSWIKSHYSWDVGMHLCHCNDCGYNYSAKT